MPSSVFSLPVSISKFFQLLHFNYFLRFFLFFFYLLLYLIEQKEFHITQALCFSSIQYVLYHECTTAIQAIGVSLHVFKVKMKDKKIWSLLQKYICSIERWSSYTYDQTKTDFSFSLQSSLFSLHINFVLELPSVLGMCEMQSNHT